MPRSPVVQASSPEYRKLRGEVIRFVLVGMLNTGFAYLVYAVLLYLGLNYAGANLGAVVSGILFSFRTQGKYVFKNTDTRRMGRFVLAWSAIYLMTTGVIGILVEAGFGAYAAGALTLPLSAVASFVVQKFFVFRIRSGKSKKLGPASQE